ncbi:hypothetical protein BDR06DRAFT_963458 [Suillus hirtellus]|nr:hypothetical protein BDR06DRAFT_963458 [Suillus hirtellus]
MGESLKPTCLFDVSRYQPLPCTQIRPYIGVAYCGTRQWMGWASDYDRALLWFVVTTKRRWTITFKVTSGAAVMTFLYIAFTQVSTYQQDFRTALAHLSML